MACFTILKSLQAHTQVCGIGMANSPCPIQAKFKFKFCRGWRGDGRVSGNKEAKKLSSAIKQISPS